MTEQKIFAGPKVKRIRKGMKLTQTVMAQQLEISPSYLNLIERNQRPLTVQLLLKLSSVYDINPDQFSGDQDGVTSQLKEVFSDPLLQGELSTYDELLEMADASPNVANGILKLHQGYREALERLSELNTLLADKDAGASFDNASVPADVLRRALEARPNYYEYLDRAAEAFSSHLDKNTGMRTSLTNWLYMQHRITVQTLPIEAMNLWRRRFDKHSMRLFVSERLDPFDQLQELATEVALLALGKNIDEEVRQLDLKVEEAKRLARFEFARYAAFAIIMPYSRFIQAAKRAKFDVEVLAGRFNVSFEQAANRLTSLGRKNEIGPNFFMLEVDQAGNKVRRSGKNGYPKSQFGGSCPKLLAYTAFARPNQLLTEKVVMPNGEHFLTIAKSLEGPSGAYGVKPRKTVLMLGLNDDEAQQTAYAPALLAQAVEIGSACRLCERQACLSRAAAPIARTLALDETGSSISGYDFKN